MLIVITRTINRLAVAYRVNVDHWIDIYFLLCVFPINLLERTFPKDVLAKDVTSQSNIDIMNEILFIQTKGGQGLELTIGKFASAVNTTIRTRRHYEQLELLVPGKRNELN